MLGDGPMNQSLERAGRVADFFELGELMVRDALAREESCGGHFREEIADPRGRGPARRRGASPTWPPGSGRARAASPRSTSEPLTFEYVHLTQRSYK